MAERQVLARLSIHPSGYGADIYPIVIETVTLVRQGEVCRLEVQQHTPSTRERKRWRVALDAAEVDARIAALKQATVPAYPVSPLVCDGEYVELRVEGEYASMTLGWWTAGPMDAEAFLDFADWMRITGLGSDDDDE